MYLPNGILTGNHKPPHCPDLSETVNLGLKLMFQVPIELYHQLREF
jgi:hypothetical protein